MGVRKIRGNVYMPGRLTVAGDLDSAALAIDTAELANKAVIDEKINWSLSAEQTGTGAAQNIAHNLGKVPAKVMIYPTGSPATYAALSITEGTHSVTDVVVTVTSGWKFKVLAIA